MTKTILITGSTDGIGKLAAIKLAKEGHEILLHGRNAEKLTKVIAQVKKLSNNENIKGFVADFLELESVEKMANQVITEVPKIDVLINNAGVFKSLESHNKNGLELRFVVNYLAPYVLTEKLIPLLQKGNSPRLINLSSAAQASVSHEALSGKQPVEVQNAYAQSKLALTMWSFYLSKKLNDITIIAVNPGSLLDTNMVKEAYGYHWSSADKGANILYDLSISEEYKEVTGKYFDNDKGEEKGIFGPAHADVYNEIAIEKLIETTHKIVEKYS